MKSPFLAILLVASAVESAWCQSAQPKTAAELAKYMGADRERVLYDGAKKEGKLVWYTSLTIYKEMAKSFEARYPALSWTLSGYSCESGQPDIERGAKQALPRRCDRN